MQRTEADGSVVICCDYCGTDWDGVLTMIEGHHGAVLCLGCFKSAYIELSQRQGEYSCLLCLREHLPSDLARWSPVPLPDGVSGEAMVCGDCIDQAARAFDRDDEVDWSIPT